MLQIKNLSKSYGAKKAVSNLSFVVEDGDIMGFIGKNGAGKTTTLKACLGIIGIDEGEILLDGTSVLKEPMACKRKMAYVPDNPQLDEYMTGLQYLNFICDIYEVPSKMRKQNFEKLASAFQMGPHLNNLISSYSHGMKQKLALIAAFSHTPKLLILDEPFVGLDPEAFVILKEQMKELCASGNSVLFSSHILDVVEKVCNKVSVIKHGQLLNGDYLLIGIYFGGVFLIGVTLLYGLIKIFRNWYSNDAIQGSKSQPVDWNKQTTKQHSPVSALLERERTRYFSLPVYLTNTACGLLFAAVFVLLVVLMSDKITPYIYQLAEYFQVPFADYDVLFIYAFSILTTISCTTYVSISIEGKQIEILKSLPIAAKCLFRVKLLHHLSMSVPTIFVLNTIMALYLQWSFPKAMLGYAFPLLCSVLIGMIGYILNLIFPNFEWENVTHIIKQSLPAILTALIGVVVTCGTAYLLLRFFPSALFMGSWLACAIILLLLLTMVAWVDKKGQHLYQEL